MRFSYTHKPSVDKIVFVAALAALALAVLFAPKTELKFGKTDIAVAIPPGGVLKASDFTALIREFEAANSGLRVSVVERTGNTDLPSGAGADIVIFDPLSSGGVDGNGGGFEEEKLLVGGINPLFYNISILQELGFDRPPKNRDEFLAVCRKFKAGAAGGVGGYAFSFSQNVFHSVLPWFYQAGAAVSNDEDRLEIDPGSRPATETFAFLKTLLADGLADGASLERSEDALVEDFIAGKCAMMICPISQIKKIDAAMPGLNYSITTIPPPANFKGRSVFNLCVLDIAVATGSEHKEEAALFLGFIEGKRGEIAAATGMIAGNLSESGKRAPIFEKAVDLYEASSIIDESKNLANPQAQAERVKDALLKAAEGAAPAALLQQGAGGGLGADTRVVDAESVFVEPAGVGSVGGEDPFLGLAVDEEGTAFEDFDDGAFAEYAEGRAVGAALVQHMGVIYVDDAVADDLARKRQGRRRDDLIDRHGARARG
jgi:ABC-type glycerol-3-phosphate transport system substrate-binding protein